MRRLRNYRMLGAMFDGLSRQRIWTRSGISTAVLYLAVAGGMGLLGLLSAGCQQAIEAEAAGDPKVPDFRLASLDGGELGPSSFSGKVVVFDFWATWCLPCHVQADILKELHKEFGEDGVEFVAVSVGESESIVRAFVEKRPFPYSVLMDPADEISAQLGIFGLPTVMVLDDEGGLAYVRTGVSPQGVLRDLLKGLTGEGDGDGAAAVAS